MDRYRIYLTPPCRGMLLQHILHTIERHTGCHFSVTFDDGETPCLTCSQIIPPEKLTWIRSLPHVTDVKRLIEIPAAESPGD